MKLRDWASLKLGAKGKKEPLGFTLGSRLPPSRRERQVATDAANAASRAISEKAPTERTAADHDRAADLHARAADAHAAGGDESRARYHGTMAKQHNEKGSKHEGVGDADHPRDDRGRFTSK